jgi:Ankyrin repeats (3 copies)/Ankyrin repeat
VTPHPFPSTSNHHPQLITSEFDCSDTVLDMNVSVPDDVDFWNLDAEESFIANLASSSSHNPSHSSTDAELISPSTAQSSSVSVPRSTSLSQSDLARSHLSSNGEVLRLHDRYLQGHEHSFDINPRNDHDTSTSGSTSAAGSGNGWLSTMHIAAQKGRDHIVRILLRRGMSFNEKDSDGRTPLVLAVIENHVAVVRALLEHGARIDDVDHEGRSALHWAVLQRHETLLSLLLDHSNGGRNLNIDAYDNVGWTPLHLAVERGFEVGMLLLLQCGANLHFRARRCPESGNVIPLDHNR